MEQLRLYHSYCTNCFIAFTEGENLMMKIMTSRAINTSTIQGITSLSTIKNLSSSGRGSGLRLLIIMLL